MAAKTTTVKLEVTVVERRGESALVEWQEGGRVHRAVIPAGDVEEGRVEREQLELGIPHGLPWETILTLSATPAALADALRRAGIWTLADLERNPRAAYGALQAVYGLDLAALIRAAHAYKP